MLEMELNGDNVCQFITVTLTELKQIQKLKEKGEFKKVGPGRYRINLHLKIRGFRNLLAKYIESNMKKILRNQKSK